LRRSFFGVPSCGAPYFYFHFDAVGGLAVGIALSTLRKVFLLLPLTFSLSVVLILAPVI
jgi:hypothetical protein